MKTEDVADQSAKSTEPIDKVVIRFAGDSGDGIQTIGDQLGLSSAVAGNDIATLPDFPAEIRAPAGTVYGVSGFQMQFSSLPTATAGDEPDVLVLFNPAAMLRHLPDLPKGGTVILDSGNFTERNFKLVNLTSNPLEDGTLDGYRVIQVEFTKLTVEALKPLGVKGKAAKRCANFFALGLTYWIYSRPLAPTLNFLKEKFKNKPEIVEANTVALKAGYHYGETAEEFEARYEVPENQAIVPGTYRSVNGNQAVAMGLVTAARKAKLDLLFAGYPITPASDLLHNLSALRHMGVKTFQAEDEIAAIGVAIGGAYAGELAATASSGPGISLKGEFLGFALSVELPLVVVNVQRGGPSTGLPTKMEQSDLFQAVFGRHGESPLPVVAASSPADAFAASFEAARIALRHMTPVILLCDGNIAFGTEPWRIPDSVDLPEIPVEFRTDPEDFKPFARTENLGRPWAIPGTPGLEHRIGGLEKEHETGNISYDPDNHQLMTDLRAEKIEAVAADYPPTEVVGARKGKLLVLSWGSPFGPVRTAVDRFQKTGAAVSHVHLRYLHPLPADLFEIMKGFDRVLVPENNTGQLSFILRAKTLTDVKGYNQVRGLPFRVGDVESAIQAQLEEIG